MTLKRFEEDFGKYRVAYAGTGKVYSLFSSSYAWWTLTVFRDGIRLAELRMANRTVSGKVYGADGLLTVDSFTNSARWEAFVKEATGLSIGSIRRRFVKQARVL